MTDQEAEQLLGTYPDCRVAVAWVEELICHKLEDEPMTAWQEMISAGMGLDRILQCLTAAAKLAMEDGCPLPMQKVLDGMAKPGFRRYLAGKMGLI